MQPCYALVLRFRFGYIHRHEFVASACANGALLSRTASYPLNHTRTAMLEAGDLAAGSVACTVRSRTAMLGQESYSLEHGARSGTARLGGDFEDQTMQEGRTDSNHCIRSRTAMLSEIGSKFESSKDTSMRSSIRLRTAMLSDNGADCEFESSKDTSMRSSIRSRTAMLSEIGGDLESSKDASTWSHTE